MIVEDRPLSRSRTSPDDWSICLCSSRILRKYFPNYGYKRERRSIRPWGLEDQIKVTSRQVKDCAKTETDYLLVIELFGASEKQGRMKSKWKPWLRVTVLKPMAQRTNGPSSQQAVSQLHQLNSLHWRAQGNSVMGKSPERELFESLLWATSEYECRWFWSQGNTAWWLLKSEGSQSLLMVVENRSLCLYWLSYVMAATYSTSANFYSAVLLPFAMNLDDIVF